MSKMNYQELPHSDLSEKQSIRNKLNSSSSVSNKGRISILFKKLTNYFLLEFAYFCPVNSVRVWCHRIRGVQIGKNVFIGMHVILDRVYPEYITLEDGCGIAGGNHLLTHTRPPTNFNESLKAYVAQVVVKEGAWLGIHSIILPNVIVGENSVVSAGSVVSHDVPAKTVVRGNPAKVVVRLK